MAGANCTSDDANASRESAYQLRRVDGSLHAERPRSVGLRSRYSMFSLQHDGRWRLRRGDSPRFAALMTRRSRQAILAYAGLLRRAHIAP